MFLDLLFPKTCLECGKPGKYISMDCLAKVGGGGIFQGTISVFRYEGVIRKAIIALKYKFSTEMARELADACAQKLNSKFQIQDSTLVPIPLYKKRQNMRGFNQSEEVGKLLAAKMGWQFEPNLLVKKVSTKPQVGLKGEARRSNLKGVFSLNSRFKIPDSIVIFDDVATTGSTILEAKKVLEKAGAKKVWGLTIAR